MDLKEQIKDLQGKLAHKQDELAKIFAEAGPEMDTSKITSLSGDSGAKVEQIRALNAEMTDLRKELDQKQELLQIGLNAKPGQVEEAPAEGKAQEPMGEHKSLGQLFTESAAFKDRGAVAHLDLDVKTLFQTSAGWEPEVTRSGLVVESAQRPIQVTDLIPTVPVSQAAYKYMEETVFTNNAAETAEGGTYGEAALQLTEKSATVEKVAVWLPMTDEQLEDVPGAAAYVDRRLRFMLRQRFDGQILNGTGTTPNLQGILNVTGIQNQLLGTDDLPDAIYKALTKVRTTGQAFPDAAIFNPADWQTIRLLKTTDGIYIWGHPAEAGPEMIWGVRTVQAQALAAGTQLVGDFGNFSLAGLRRGVDVQVTNAHSDFFVNGKQAVRADFRVVLVWTRPAAFCTVTTV